MRRALLVCNDPQQHLERKLGRSGLCWWRYKQWDIQDAGECYSSQQYNQRQLGPSGGGIDNGGNAELSKSILNGGASGDNNGGTVTSHGYNISSDNGGGVLTGTGDQIKTDPLLGPLQDNGGPTLTHLPGLGSPAIDAGDQNFARPPITTNAARVFTVCLVVASMSVLSRRNRGHDV